MARRKVITYDNLSKKMKMEIDTYLKEYIELLNILEIYDRYCYNIERYGSLTKDVNEIWKIIYLLMVKHYGVSFQGFIFWSFSYSNTPENVGFWIYVSYTLVHGIEQTKEYIKMKKKISALPMKKTNYKTEI